ncbi:MAG TPA: hypothetical protein VJX10_20755 [Pseudonocardiaceae bacterium]|nr:hypothetical protein [Pseudonocardiaceae bacterium]
MQAIGGPESTLIRLRTDHSGSTEPLVTNLAEPEGTDNPTARAGRHRKGMAQERLTGHYYQP